MSAFFQGWNWSFLEGGSTFALICSLLGLPIHLVVAPLGNAEHFSSSQVELLLGVRPDQQHRELYSIFPMYRSLPTAAAAAVGTRKQAMHAMLFPLRPQGLPVRENDPAPYSVLFNGFVRAEVGRIGFVLFVRVLCRRVSPRNREKKCLDDQRTRESKQQLFSYRPQPSFLRFPFSLARA